MLLIRFRTERETDGKAMIPSSLQSRPRVRQDMTQRKDRPIHRFTLLWLSIRHRRDMWHIDLTPTLTLSAHGELGPIDLFCWC
jgi:hypothetical protein